jgi:ribonuclease HII
MPPIPTFAEEKILRREGYRLIAGVDEVGCGALAGPVVAAAVILPHRLPASWSKEVKDSKQLTPAKRETLFHHIHEIAVAVGVGAVSHEIIDAHGLTHAVRLAMTLAINRLSPPPDSLLIDFVRLPQVKIPQKGITNGDELCFSIACASIIAKVSRDTMMTELDRVYPGYGLAQHKGYGTREHLSCLRRLGPSPIHRRSYQPVAQIVMEL